MKPIALLVVSTLLGCSSSDDDHHQQPDQPDAATACALEPRLERGRFATESVNYLRAAFATTTGFEGGVITYGETAVPLADGGCPVADWTGLSYTVPVDAALVPLELRGTIDRVSAFWSLNGRKAVVFLPSAAPTSEFDLWLYGQLPDNVNAVVRPDADPDEVREVVEQLRALRPALEVEHLEEIGVLTVTAAIGNFLEDTTTTVTVPQMEAAAQLIRASKAFSSVEWSGVVLRYPNESWAGQPVADELLAPECERTHTRAMRDQGVFTTAPSFAPPLGTGPSAVTPTCE